MKRTVIRKDGIQYERFIKPNLCDKTLTIRISEQTLNKLKEVATIKNVKYNTMVRNIIEEYIEEYFKETI